MNTKQQLFPRHIFRAYDIRGNVSLLSPQIVYAIAVGLAKQYLGSAQQQVVLGYDARITSPFYAKILKQVLENHKIQVHDIGCCSTPQMYFAARKSNGNGIMVTASHNPKEDNGIKWIVMSEPPTPEMIQLVADDSADVFDQALQINDLDAAKHHIKAEYCFNYQAALIQDIQLKRSLRVVLDGMHGSAGRCADLVLQKMGCEVISIRCQHNGNFPDHAPDPSTAAHLQQLQHKIKLHQADIGIALDGDGDRVVILDEHANIISPDRLLSFFAQICLLEHPEHEIVFDVKCSSMVKKTVEKLGGKATMIRTGSSFMRKYISQSNGGAVFGGEYAGHYVFNDGRGYGYDDGLYAALRVMEYLSAQKNQSLSQIFAQYPERFSTEDTYIQTNGVNPKQVLDFISDESQQFGAQALYVDGVRLDFENSFGIIRASNTGEFFTVRFDASCANELAEIRQKFVSMLCVQYPKIAQDISNAQ